MSLPMIKVSLADFGHFDHHCIFWTCLKEKLVKEGQLLGYHLCGFTHNDKEHVPHLIFQVKAYDSHEEFEADPVSTKDWRSVAD